MALYFIGLGLNSEKDVTVRGLEAIKKCDSVYLESYTSVLNCTKNDLEKFFDKKIFPANRNLVESDGDEIINRAREKNVAFLVCGDPFVATTHADLFLRAKKCGVDCRVIHNSSIISAVGATGLQAYKFGRTTSIPMDNENTETPYNALVGNLGLGLHTLFLLDIDTEEGKFMSINDAIRYLLKLELKMNQKIFSEKIFCIGCGRLGSETQVIKAGAAKDLLNYDFGKPVHCLIVPGKLHFVEEHMLELWK